MEAGLGFEHFAHLYAVELLVALGARAPDGGTARRIQQAKLDADGIGNLAHDAAECVDFAHKVPLGDAANGGIAAHLGNEVHVHGDERGFQAHARGGHGGFAARMAGAHHNHVVLFGESHPILFYGFAVIEAFAQEYCWPAFAYLGEAFNFSIMSAFLGLMNRTEFVNSNELLYVRKSG